MSAERSYCLSAIRTADDAEAIANDARQFVLEGISDKISKAPTTLNDVFIIVNVFFVTLPKEKGR